MIDLSQHKLDISYPCDWTYKVIGASDKEITDAVSEIMFERDHNLNVSNRSSKGKFVSYTLKTLVHTEKDRLNLFKLLSEHSNIIRVLWWIEEIFLKHQV